MRRLSARITTLAMLVAGLGFTTLDCSRHSSGNDVGSLHLALSTGGYTINKVTYTITTQATPAATVLGPVQFDVSDPNATPSLDVVLPVGDYKVLLSAQSVTPAGHTFTGNANFHIASGAPTNVSVTLSDTALAPGQAPGVANIVGVITPQNNPPVIDSAVVAPAQTSAGAPIGVTAVAHDPDAAAGDSVSFHWSVAPDGAFADPSAANTTFSANTHGTKHLTLTVTDTHAATASITVDVNIIGDVTVDAAGGTVSQNGVTLTIPAGAVAGPTAITVTPVTGARSGRRVHGGVDRLSVRPRRHGLHDPDHCRHPAELRRTPARTSSGRTAPAGSMTSAVRSRRTASL